MNNVLLYLGNKLKTLGSCVVVYLYCGTSSNSFVYDGLCKCKFDVDENPSGFVTTIDKYLLSYVVDKKEEGDLRGKSDDNIQGLPLPSSLGMVKDDNAISLFKDMADINSTSISDVSGI